MQPDTVNSENEVAKYYDLKQKFQNLKAACGLDGVTVDCWWGAVEKAPQHYEWSGYKKLFRVVRECGLKLQVRASKSKLHMEANIDR